MSDVISIQSLTMRFRGCEALRGIDLAIQPGTVFALLGENGAGKTTLIRVLTGFQKPTSGHCRVLGLDPTNRNDCLQLRKRVGYVSDAPALYDWMTVGEIGWFTSSFYPDGFLERYRDSIQGYELPENRKIKQLSKGQRAKVALALALAPDPELLILDEPTSGLDPIVRREFLESMITVAATGRTVLLSSHQIAEVERVADRIAILHQGRIALEGDLAKLRESILMVTLSLNDPFVALPDLDPPCRVLTEIREGRQIRFIVEADESTVEQVWGTRAGVTLTELRQATLDELFLASTRGGTKRAPSTSEPQPRREMEVRPS